MNETKKLKEELLIVKLNLLNQMHENTTEQSSAIQAKEEKQLTQLIKARDTIIQQIRKADEKIKQIPLQGSENEKVIEIKQQVENRLKEIYAIDQKNIKDVKVMKDELEASMRHVNQGKKALTNGYFKQMPQLGGYFIDKKIGK